MKNVRKLLKDKEWSMGNGQCPECYGVPEDWIGHPLYLNSKNIGHKADCILAKSMQDVGLKPLYIGKSKIKKEYETYIDDMGIYSTRPKTKEGCPKLKEMNRELQKKFDDIIFDALLNPIIKELK
jgi:hypothetical protein